jgi:outer membrane immunogenic protein
MKKVLLSLGIASAMMANTVVAQEQTTTMYVGAGFGVVAVPDEEDFEFSDANNGFIQLGYQFTENFAIEGQYSKSTKDASNKQSIEGLNISQAWWDALMSENPGMTYSDAQALYPYAEMSTDVVLDANIETTAIYGAYRSGGDLYFKVKAGYLKEEVTITAKPTSIDFFALGGAGVNDLEFSLVKGDEGFEDFTSSVDESFSESESGFSGGLGLGYKFTEQLFSELEYTMLTDDLDMYSLSVNFAF